MTTIPNGVVGGGAAAIIAVGLTRLLTSEWPGARMVAAIGAGEYRWSRWRAIGVGYGGIAGGTLVVLDLYVFDRLGVPPSALEAFGAGVVWGAVLCAGALAVGWIVTNRSGSVIVRQVVLFHILYGLGLGLWIRLTWIT